MIPDVHRDTKSSTDIICHECSCSRFMISEYDQSYLMYMEVAVSKRGRGRARAVHYKDSHGREYRGCTCMVCLTRHGMNGQMISRCPDCHLTTCPRAVTHKRPCKTHRAENSVPNGISPDKVVFSPRTPQNVLTWGSSFGEKQRAVTDEYARWVIDWNTVIGELEETTASPEVWSARLTLVDMDHDVENMIRVLGWLRKGAHTIRKRDRERWCRDVIEILEHRYDGIQLVSSDTGEVHDVTSIACPSD